MKTKLWRRLVQRVSRRATAAEADCLSPSMDHTHGVTRPMLPVVDPNLLTLTDEFVLRGAATSTMRLQQLLAERPDLAAVLSEPLAATQRIGRNAIYELATRQAHEREGIAAHEGGPR